MKNIEVKLIGELGRKFGRRFRFVASSPRDIMSALCNQLEGFKEYMASAHEKGVAFRLVNDDSEGMEYENVIMPCDRLIIAPIVTGSGAFGRILLGITLIALAFIPAIGGFVLGTIGKTALTAGNVLFGLGSYMVLGGIASLFSPQPQSNEPTESFLFDRSTELTTQGQPIPLLYGRFLAASPLVVSSSITTQQVPV